jgi:hypothetical protein
VSFGRPSRTLSSRDSQGLHVQGVPTSWRTSLDSRLVSPEESERDARVRGSGVERQADHGKRSIDSSRLIGSIVTHGGALLQPQVPYSPLLLPETAAVWGECDAVGGTRWYLGELASHPQTHGELVEHQEEEGRL